MLIYGFIVWLDRHRAAGADGTADPRARGNTDVQSTTVVPAVSWGADDRLYLDLRGPVAEAGMAFLGGAVLLLLALGCLGYPAADGGGIVS